MKMKGGYRGRGRSLTPRFSLACGPVFWVFLGLRPLPLPLALRHSSPVLASTPPGPSGASGI